MKLLFENCSAGYDAYRLAYPDELFDFLVERCTLNADSVIVDVGAGTGKGSAGFLERDFRVIAVDPGERMLRTGSVLLDAEKVCAQAQTTALQESLADLVVCAQSFHWFQTPATLTEFRRILKPTGHLALYWNTRQAGTPHTAAYERLIMTYNPEHRYLDRDKDWSSIAERTNLFRIIAHRSYDHTQLCRLSPGRAWPAARPISG